VRPLRVDLSNFLSYPGSHAIDFTSANVIVLSGPNGAGKSAIPDSVRFGLFGFTRGTTLDAMITDGAENAKVAVTFGLDDRRYQATRTRRRGKSSTVTFGELHDDGGVDVLEPKGRNSEEAQAAILDLLGMDDALFRMTAFVGQGDSAAFTSARASKRKDALGRVLILEEWAGKSKLARDRLGAIERERTGIEATKANAELVAGQAPQLREAVKSDQETVAGLTGEVTRWQASLDGDREKRNKLAEQVATFEAATATSTAAAKGLLEGQNRTEAAALRFHELSPLVLKGDEAAVLNRKIQRLEADEGKARSLAEARQKAAHFDAVVAKEQTALTEAKTSHDRETERARARLDGAIEAHRRELAALQDRHAAHSTTAELLDKVPCPEKAPTIVAECLLLGAARKSSGALPDLAASIEKLKGQEPGQNERTILAGLAKVTPGLTEGIIERLEKARGDRAAVPWDAENDPDRLDELTKGLEALPRLREKWGNQEKLAAALAEARKVHEAAMVTLAEARETATKAREAIPDDPGPDLRLLDSSIATETNHLDQARAELSTANADLTAATTKLGLAEKCAEQVKELEAKDTTLLRRQKALEVLVEAFGRDGVPALLVERAVPNLEAVANDLLDLLSDGRLRLRFETQKETTGGELRESLNIFVSDERGEREYENYSGGERMRIDLAIRAALSALLAQRKRSHCDLLVLDETAAPLDQEGQDAFVEALDRISSRFGLILVVTHLEDLKARFPARLEVTKTAAGSRAELVAA